LKCHECGRELVFASGKRHYTDHGAVFCEDCTKKYIKVAMVDLFPEPEETDDYFYID